MKPKDQVLEVWGELACFSRPEFKVERFSYPVITPSAARGIFDAIYCKPSEFRWQVKKIEILSPPNYIALRRNEVKDKVPAHAVTKWMAGTGKPEPLWADGDREMLGTDQRGRTQRQTMALKDVRYRLHGVIYPWPGFEDRIKAMESQFQRRASKGKCVYQPYFGCREFPAYFRLVEPEPSRSTPEALNMDLGFMLYDVFDLSRPGTCEDKASISLFHAVLSDGVMEVPEYASDRVLKGARRQ